MRQEREGAQTEGGDIVGAKVALAAFGVALAIAGVFAGADGALPKGLALIVLGDVIAAAALVSLRDGAAGRGALGMGATVAALTLTVMALATGGLWA